MMRAYHIAMLILGALHVGQAQSTHGLLRSEGVILNTGRLRIHGDATLTQSSIGGQVEYAGSDVLDTQRIAPVMYESLHFEGAAVKRIQDDARPVESTAFFSTTTEAGIDNRTSQPVLLRGGMHHNGRISGIGDSAVLRLAGARPQRVSGYGLVPVLEIANRSLVLLLDDAMLRIGKRIDLQVGTLDNRSAGYIILHDSAWVWRNDSASISGPLIPDGIMHARYYGRRSMTTGPELPRQHDMLGDLLQDNVGGVALGHDLTVNGMLLLRGHVFTEPDSASRYALTLASGADPVFVDAWPEVDGTMIRTSVPLGRPLLMNASHTAITFDDDAGRGNVSAIRLRTKRRTLPPGSRRPEDKVRRSYHLSMLDTVGRVLPDSTFRASFQYAWRVQPGSTEVDSVVEVTDVLSALQDSLILLRRDGSDYVDHGESLLPTRGDSTSGLWRAGRTMFVRANGDFAVGLSSITPAVAIDVQVLLEGGLLRRAPDIVPSMRTDLRAADLVPSTPPQGYPFDLDSGLRTEVLGPLPDSVVDWIVVELRSDLAGGRRYFRSGLVTRHGRVVEPIGNQPLLFRQVRTDGYFVVLHHRNHLRVMTERRTNVRPGNGRLLVDFTMGNDIFGGASSMVAAASQAGRIVWAVPVGDVDQTLSVDRDDWGRWPLPDVDEGYLQLDTSMDGVVSTSDHNLIWNNRGRTSAVP
jgi:hypothetical protein